MHPGFLLYRKAISYKAKKEPDFLALFYMFRIAYIFPLCKV